MNPVRIFVAFVVLCFSTPIFATNCTTNLYFINGVGYKNASNLTFIISRIKALFRDDPSICVQPPLFNSGVGLLGDISETYALKFVAESGVFTSFANIFQGWMAETIQLTINYFTGKTQPDLKIAKQLNEMTAIVQADVNAGKNVLLVAHSEGNLFAKEIVRRINATSPQGVERVVHFGVAVPTTMVADTVYHKYLTASADGIIKLVSNSAVPNFTSSNNPDPLSLNHDFLASYLNVNHLGNIGFMDDPALSDKQGVDIQTIFVSMVKRASKCIASPCIRLWFS